MCKVAIGRTVEEMSGRQNCGKYVGGRKTVEYVDVLGSFR
jgi:hypothetical protein